MIRASISNQQTGYALQGDADIDTNGKFSVNRGVVEISTRKRTSQRLFTGIG
jgi:hypothetical protein